MPKNYNNKKLRHEELSVEPLFAMRRGVNKESFLQIIVMTILRAFLQCRSVSSTTIRRTTVTSSTGSDVDDFR